MTDSSTDDISQETAQNNCATDEDELSQLRSLLLGTEVQEILDAPKLHAGDLSHEALESDRSMVEDELDELRNLLLSSEKQNTSNLQTEDLSSVQNNPSTVEDGLDELRNLVLGPELQKRLATPKVGAEDLSQVLPEAFILRSMQDKQLSEAMVPTVEDAIQASVKKDLNVLSEAIFPVIGPASRKAIATALEATIESLNQAVEYSLSPQSFKWRLEAIQTGKSFAEVVILRTLLYRVEQVFLIHKTTGLLLQHVVAEAVAARDADLVSAMLTAIQDFVRDSFKVQQGEMLETLHFGELTIWIEQGPQAILASVIRGHPPKELRLVFQETIEKIHLKQSKALNSFQGDASPFAASQPYLEACLQTQYKAKKEKHYPYIYIFFGVAAIALGIWGFFTIKERMLWTAYLEKLQAERGIAITSTKKYHGKYFISGLRDPLAADPSRIMKESNINPDAVISKWEPYLSLDAEFTTKRAREFLKPPQSVSLKVDENRILYATGEAPWQWIRESRKLAQVIPGITKFQDNLVATELRQLELSKKQIEKQLLLFQEGTTQLRPGQGQTLQSLFREIKKLFDAAQVLDKDVRIQIVGRATYSGSEQTNISLSQARASAVLSTLVAKGFNKANLTTVGVGSNQPLRRGFTELDKAFNRSVTFKVIFMSTPNK